MTRRDCTVLLRGGRQYEAASDLWKTLDVLHAELVEAYDRSTNLSEFNAIWMSRIVNLHWGLPTAFLPATRAVPLFLPALMAIVQDYDQIIRASNEVIDRLQSAGVTVANSLRPRPEVVPLWYVCWRCSVRVELRRTVTSDTHASGTCGRCGSLTALDLRALAEGGAEPPERGVVPRILVDDLADCIVWGAIGGTAYLGSAEHVVVSGLIGKYLGLEVPLDMMWRPRGMYYGPSEWRAGRILTARSSTVAAERARIALRGIFAGRMTILYYALSRGLIALAAQWMNRLKEGGLVTDVNFGDPAATVDVKGLGMLVELATEVDVGIDRE